MFIRIFLILFPLLLLSHSISLAGSKPCLHFEPTMVELRGYVKEVVFPGPPNYESILSGDEAEHCLILILSAAVCVQGDASSDMNSQSTYNIKKIQLAVMSDRVYRRIAGKSVTLKGTLFTQHTGHHRTPVLMEVKSVQKVK